MWFTHFVACVDYCCRLSPDGGQLDASVCRGPPTSGRPRRRRVVVAAAAARGHAAAGSAAAAAAAAAASGGAAAAATTAAASGGAAAAIPGSPDARTATGLAVEPGVVAGHGGQRVGRRDAQVAAAAGGGDKEKALDMALGRIGREFAARARAR